MSALIKKNCPIGVFDSGLGGLTVVKALKQCLPNESIVYFGDTARVPYGTKSRESIIKFSRENAAILLKHNVKIIVVACNSSSSYALGALKKYFSVPVVGVIKPGVKKAVSVTRNKRVGVIATPATIHSKSYERQIKRFDSSIRVVSRACPLFVPIVEEGLGNHDVAMIIGKEYLAGMKGTHVDTVILGCTHYPLLKTVLRKIMGQGVTLVDSAQEVAFEVKALLSVNDLNKSNKAGSRDLFFVSDTPNHFRKLARKFLGYSIKNVKRCDHSPAA